MWKSARHAGARNSERPLVDSASRQLSKLVVQHLNHGAG